MTAGVEVVCGEVARKVEIEVNSSDLSGGGGGVTVDCDVGGGGSGNGGDSACVFVNEVVEVSDDDPGDTGDVSVGEVDRFKEEGLGSGYEGVIVDSLVSESDVKGVVYVENGSAVDPPVVLVTDGVDVDVNVNGHLDKESGEQKVDVKSTEEVVGLTESTQNTIESSEVAVSELAANVAQFKKEELGLETEGIQVDPLVCESNGIVHESTTVSAAEVEAVKDDVNLGNGSTVDPPVVLVTNGVDVDVNGHLDKVSGEQEADVKSTEEVDGLTESTQITIESSEVAVSELEAANVYEVAQFKKEELGLETEGVPVNPLVLESNSIVYESTTVSAAEVKAVKDDVNLVNESTVDVTNGVCVDVKGHLDKISGERDGDVKSIEEVDGLTESTQNTIESSQVTVSELEAAIKPSDVTVSTADCEMMVNDGPESIIKLVEKSACQATVDDSGKTSEDLEFQLAADGSESSGSLIEELEGQATVDEPESCESPVKEQKCEVSVAGPDSIGCLVDNQECPVSVDESEPGSNDTKKVESDTIVMELDGKLEEHQELLVITSEVNVEAENKNSKEDDALANGQVEKFDRILEMGETQISETDADGSSEKLVKVTESVEMEVNTEEMTEHVKVEDEILESQTVVIDNVQDELNLEGNTEEYANEAEVSLESDIQYGVSNCIEKLHLQSETSAENVETTNILESECNSGELLVQKDNDSLSNSDDSTVFEQKVAIASDDDEKETAVKVVKDVPHLVPEIRSPEVMDCGTQVENVVSDNEEKGTEVNDASVGDHSALTFSDTIVNHGVEIEFGSIGCHKSIPSIQNKEVEGMNGIQSDEIPNSSIEGEEVNDAIDAQNEEIEVLEYNFLVKIPRFEDENLRDQIRSAHAIVVEKTRLRDSIRVVGQEKRERLRIYNEEFEAEKKKEIAARRVVKAKRQEIEAVQAVINRWKNAMSVEDIDSRIFGVEYMIQHETIQLKDEKEFIREIRQLKSLRDQLASNMGTPEEIRHAIDTKDHNEKRLKVLRKELEDLKAEVSKIVAVIQKIMKKYEELSREEKEMQCRFRAADESRQKAYAHLNSLRKLSYDKNTNFRQFKEDLTKAKTYLSQGDKDALHRLCANQVETFMEQWNNNNEFRQEYIRRCNCIASRKQKALDGAPPVPDDVAPVLPSNVIEKVDTSPVSLLTEVKHVAVVLPVEQEKNASVSPTENKNAYSNETDKPIENTPGQKKQELKNKSVVKPTNLGSTDVAKEEAEVGDNIPTKEEIELARKAEELKREEIAKLKEQRRLEEKAKAVEALERKKRNAEKAQLRAELRARKEAEQKEKEREKRLRKKEKKTDGIIEEEAAGSENEATPKETETAANKKKTKKPPAHFFSRQPRQRPAPVPPQVLNRNRRRWQQAGRIALVALAVVVVFLLANFGLFLGFKPAKLKYMRF